MIFSGLEQMGDVPYHTVLIHGLVRDEQGRKMSKSLGNGIDPLKVIDEYGADALRLTLATGNSPGNDMRYSDAKVRSSRNFANKLWNASRFILMNLDDSDTDVSLPDTLTIEDKWILTQYNQLVKEATENLEKFELGMAVQKIYDFIWDVLCDWYIELTKSRLQAGGDTSKAARQILVYVMSNTLKLLHPFMPFITEEIWQALPHDGESIMISRWPEFDPDLDFKEEARQFTKVMDAIKAVRNRRAEMNVPPSKKASLHIETSSPSVFENCVPFLERLASASNVEVGKEFHLLGAVQVITDSAKIYIPMEELIDKEKELARLNKEKASCERDIEFIRKKLDNPGFVAKAPAQLVETERGRLATAQERLAKIEESIAALEK